MRMMANVNSRLGARGTTFANSFVNLSWCCPSRATFLTGQYAHNHGVFEFDGFAEFNAEHGGNTLPAWLQRTGYYTAHVGKYLNGYEDPSTATLVPRGWDEWYAATEGDQLPVQAVYDYTLNENGTLVDYGESVSDFKQDVFTAKAVDVINRRAPAEQPFFLSVAYTAPHREKFPSSNLPQDCRASARPAPRHAMAFDTEPLPLPPSFNEQDVSDKPPDIQALAPITSAERSDIERKFRCRLESLLSVDEGVSAILDALSSHHELDETLVIFTSDNGYLQGEHRVRYGKRRHYEPSTRVPLIVRGPGVPEGETVGELAINADLAPTILDATDSTPGLERDGRSLIDLARDPTLGRNRALLFETTTYTAIRTARYK